MAVTYNPFTRRYDMIVTGGVSASYSSTLTTNGSYEGETRSATVDDGSTVFGDTLYINSSFNYERADASSVNTSPAIAVALSAGSGSSKQMLLRGQICNTSWSLSKGLVYLSTTTGGIAQTIVSGTGDQHQILGYSLSSTTVFFDPDLSIAEIS